MSIIFIAVGIEILLHDGSICSWSESSRLVRRSGDENERLFNFKLLDYASAGHWSQDVGERLIWNVSLLAYEPLSSRRFTSSFRAKNLWRQQTKIQRALSPRLWQRVQVRVHLRIFPSISLTLVLKFIILVRHNGICRNGGGQVASQLANCWTWPRQLANPFFRRMKRARRTSWFHWWSWAVSTNALNLLGSLKCPSSMCLDP